jgi:Fuc2NAc and GlcNAc transferase
LEHPNHRSSHFIAVPGGAGIVLLVCYSLSLVFIHFIGPGLGGAHGFWLCPLILGVVGLLDDHKELSSPLRLALYAALIAITIVSLSIGSQPPLVFQLFSLTIDCLWLLVASAVLLLLWWVNLFNFMDGINGIAGFQAVFVLVAAILLSPALSMGEQYLIASVLGGSLGFLCWNFPQAKVFMGDAGSIFLGAFIGFLAFKSNLSIWQWGILLAVFFVDATYTLLLRMVTGQQWHKPHRCHAYQIMARRLKSHAIVVWLIVAINVLWLYPLAWYAAKEVYYAPLIMLTSWLPLIGVCYTLGAGHIEEDVNA